MFGSLFRFLIFGARKSRTGTVIYVGMNFGCIYVLDFVISQSMDRIKQLEEEIAELKRARAEAKLHTDRFRAIFEHSRLGNKIINKDLEIIQANKALVDLLGFDDKADIIGRRILEFAPADRHADWAFLQEKLWSNLTPSFSLETCLFTKTGAIVWCQVTSILIPNDGDTLGYTIIEDITEQHKLRMQGKILYQLRVMNLKLRLPIFKRQFRSLIK